MKLKWYIYVIVTLSMVAVGSLLFSGYTISKSKLYEDELNKQYVQDTLRIRKQLDESIKSRANSDHIIDSLYSVNKAISASDSVNKAKLSRIPGRFQNLSSKQLQDKMIEEYVKYVNR